MVASFAPLDLDPAFLIWTRLSRLLHLSKRLLLLFHVSWITSPELVALASLGVMVANSAGTRTASFARADVAFAALAAWLMYLSAVTVRIVPALLRSCGYARSSKGVRC